MVDDYPNPYGPSPLYARASIAVWGSAGLLLALSVCCVGVMTMFAVMPIGELKQMEGMESVPAETWDQMAQAQPYMSVIVAITAAITLLPALTLLVLGFFVRGGRRGAAIAAQVLCWIPLGLVIVNIALSLPAVLTSGVAAVIGVLPSLVLGGVLFWAIKSLRAALRSPAVEAFDHPPRTGSPDDDPWEHLL